MWIYLTTKPNVQFDEKTIDAGSYYIGTTYDLTVHYVHEMDTHDLITYNPKTVVAVYSVPVIYTFLQIVRRMHEPHWQRRAYAIKDLIKNFNHYEPHMYSIVMDYFNHTINLYRTSNIDPALLNNYDSHVTYLPRCYCGIPCTIFKSVNNRFYFKCSMSKHIQDSCGMNVEYTKFRSIFKYTHSPYKISTALRNASWLRYVAIRSTEIKLKNCFNCSEQLYYETRVNCYGMVCNLCWDCLCTRKNEYADTIIRDWIRYHRSRSTWEIRNYDRRDMTLYDPAIDS